MVEIVSGDVNSPESKPLQPATANIPPYNCLNVPDSRESQSHSTLSSVQERVAALMGERSAGLW